MASAPTPFQLLWKPGKGVQEIAPPHRKGVIRAVQGSGPATAIIVVNLAGRGPTSFRPGQLALL